MVGVAVIGSNSLALSPILDDVAAALGAAPVEIARAVAAYGAATALSALALGGVIDRHGPGRALAAAMAVIAVAMAASAAAPHWLALAGAQALAGLGAGLALPATYALATASAPPGEGARALGRVLLGWSVSLVAGVPLAAAIADAAGWRAGFVLLAAMAAAMAMTAPRHRDRIPASAGPRGFRAALAVRDVPVLLGICLALMTSFYGVYAFFGTHMRELLGLTASGAGTAILAYGIGFGAGGAGDGLADRLGPRRVLPLALAGGAAVYALMPLATTLPAFVALAGAWGFVNHFALNMLVLQLSAADPARRGSILGANSAVTYLGALLGAAGLGEIFARAGFPALSWTGAALMLLAAMLAARLALARRPDRRDGV